MLLPWPLRALAFRMYHVALGMPKLSLRLGIIDRVAAPYADWSRDQERLLDTRQDAILAHIATLPRRPLISVVMPTYDTPEPLLRAVVASVQAQLWPNWELCIADDASPSPHVARVLAELAEADGRIRWTRRTRNGHISAASNTALSLANGEWVALLDHDDLLPRHALYRIAVAALDHPEAALLFSDEDKVDNEGRHFGAYFKTGLDPDLLLGQNMVSHLGVYRRDLLQRLGGWREGLEGSQDYDLVLRALDAVGEDAVVHVPGVLYHWRFDIAARRSFSAKWLDQCVANGRRAVSDHLVARGMAGAAVEPAPGRPQWNRVRWPLPDPPPAVSLILMPRGNAAPTFAAVAPLLAGTSLAPAEVLVPLAAEAPPPASPAGLRALACGAGAGWAARANRAVQEATGSVVVLLGAEPEPIDPDWLRELVSQALRPELGAAGGVLLRPDGRILRAELALDGTGAAEPAYAGYGGIAGYLNALAAGYFGALGLARRVGALAGDCLALRRDAFLAAGGADPALDDEAAQLDLSLRLRATRLHLVFTPFAALRERSPTGVPMPRNPGDGARMAARWGDLARRDPARNPLLAVASGRPVLAGSPLQPDMSALLLPGLDSRDRQGPIATPTLPG